MRIGAIIAERNGGGYFLCVPSKPPRTPLINSPASFIISLKLGSLMMKLFLQSLKLVTKNTVCTSYKLSLGKWVTHSCRPMRDPQFLERGIRDRVREVYHRRV